MRFSSIAIGCVLLTLTAPAGAQSPAPASRAAVTRPATDLRTSERRHLLAGELVTRPMQFSQDGGQYVGGLSYQVVRAAPEEVLATLLDVRRLPEVLPRTKSARLLSSSDGESVVELTQGNALVDATYSVRLRRDVGSDEIRFWLDPSRAHGVHDVWGYFRVQPFDAGRSLLTVAVALDLGPGFARMFFEQQIQSLVLSTPRRIRDFVEPRALAARD
jgi:carbon monoxide dehydrogenase subunit G